MKLNANYIPQFIAQKYEKENYRGHINGSVLFSDISGFTSMTEKLFESGKSGAEELFVIMKELFSIMSDAVYSCNGFISSFAGDAFTAIFPDDTGINACKAALYIREHLPQELSVGGKVFPISVKSGISSGIIDWSIFKSGASSYIFTGMPVKAAADNEGKCNRGDIVISQETASALNTANFSLSSNDDVILLDSGDSDIDIDFTKPLIITRSLQSAFINEDILDRTAAPEIRNIIPVFINFRSSDDTDDAHIITTIRTILEKYGGYFNMLDYGDKGNVILSIFGAPRTYENIIQRAIGFVEEIRNELQHQIRIGLTVGRAYTGYIGSSYRGTYTGIGDTLNLAARFMQKAQWGDIWLSEDIGRQIYANYMIEYMGSMEFKGKKENIHFYKLLDKTSQSIEFNYENAFIGRTEEINNISDFLERTVNGNKQSIGYISGDAGIGKTRLIFEAQKPYISDANIIYTKCDDVLKKSLNPIEYFYRNFFNTDNMDSFRTSFNSFLDSLNTVNDIKSLLDSVMNKQYILEGFLNIHVSEAYALLDAKARFNNVYIAFFEIISLLSFIKPVILNIDDIQWIDEDTASIVSNMLQQLSNYSVCIMFISRTSPSDSRIADALSKRNLFSLAIKRLREKDSNELISQELPYTPDNTLKSLIASKTEGNPFFVEQFCLFLMEKDFLDFSDNMSKLKNSDIELPRGISGIIVSRIDALTNDVKEVIQNASVLGRTFNIDILSKMLKRDISPPLAVGEDEKIWNSLTKLQYIFRHSMIHETVYSMQLNRNLASIHELAANIMEQDFGNDEHHFSELSYHYWKAGNNDKMLIYTEKAADFAINNYMNEEALTLLHRYIDNSTDQEKFMLIHMKIGEVYEVQSKWKEAIEVFSKPEKFFKSRNPGYYGDCLNRKGFINYRLGNKEKALEYYNKAHAVYDSHGNIPGLVSTYNNRAITLMSMEKHTEAESFLKLTVESIDHMNTTRRDQQILMFAYNNLGLLYMNMRKLDLAEHHFSKSINISEAISDARSTAFMNLGNIQFLKGELDKAEEIYTIAMKNAIALGDRHMARVIMNNMGSLLSLRFEYDKALELLDDSLRIARELGDREGERLLLSNIGDILAIKGEYASAYDFLDKAYKMAIELENKKGIAIASGNMGMVYYLNNQPKQAMNHLEEAVSICHEHGYFAYEHQFLYYQIICILDNHIDGNIDTLSEQFANIDESFIDKNDKWKKAFIEAKLIALDQPDKALSLFIDIANQYDGEGHAYALKEIYKIKKDSESCNAYRESFEKLYKVNPKYIYKLEFTI